MEPPILPKASKMNNYKKILKEYWGFDDFRGIQYEIIKSICEGKDTLGLMPTGGGKSLTFQIPAIASEGICIVITPLIALMKDQVEHLREKGIKAAAIHMGLSHEKVIITLENCIFGDYKLLYISPERLGSELFQKKLSHMHVSFICIDEAHCISQWGYDFRPSYLQIKQIRKLVPNVPVLALTATATTRVVADIQEQLGFHKENVFRMSFERKNLAYKVYKSTDRIKSLKLILKEKEGSCIIYCRNRQKCKELTETLQEWGYTSTYYHAGLTNSEKDERQKKWQKGKTRIMVATNAFGMGIDKADVRLVIHIGIPDAIESYFQEAGRAGRDGLSSEAILLYDGNDTKTLKKRIDEAFPAKEIIKNIYEEICCYLKIAIGYGQGQRREFNLVDFCKKFHHYPTIVEGALSLLTKAGYIIYTDSEEPTSRVMFNIKRDDLYRIQANEQEKAKIIQCLLRQYEGLFVKFVAIDEKNLSSETNLSEERIYNILRTLTQQHILTYIPKKSIPHITFTHERKEKNEIHFNKVIYEERRNILKEQIENMLEYVTEENNCRNRFLLEYFGEEIKTECGHCDICEEKNKQQSITKEIKNKLKNVFTITNQKTSQQKETINNIKKIIIRNLRENGKTHPFSLNMEDYDTELIRQAMDELVEENTIRMDENLWIELI